MLSVEPDFCLPLAAGGRTGLLLAGAGGLLNDLADVKLAPAGIDGREYSILAILKADSPGSQLEISRLLGKAPALVVAAIDDLEARGLVARTRDPADRRRSRVTITAAGAKALDEGDKLADALVVELFPGLDAGEIQQLQDLLAKGLSLGLPDWARAS